MAWFYLSTMEEPTSEERALHMPWQLTMIKLLLMSMVCSLQTVILLILYFQYKNFMVLLFRFDQATKMGPSKGIAHSNQTMLWYFT